MDKTALRQRARKLASLYQDPQGLTHCPITGTDGQSNNWKIFLLPGGGQDIWWHALVVDNRKK